MYVFQIICVYLQKVLKYLVINTDPSGGGDMINLKTKSIKSNGLAKKQEASC